MSGSAEQIKVNTVALTLSGNIAQITVTVTPTALTAAGSVTVGAQAFDAQGNTIIGQALWSDRIRLGTLDSTRDFTFVADTASGLASAAATPAVEGTAFNLGFGAEISIGELAEVILDLIGTRVPIEQHDTRMRPAASEVRRLRSDPSRAAAAFGWHPRYSLREGLALTIDWIRSRGPLERLAELTV